jgi:carbonic anhydrase
MPDELLQRLRRFREHAFPRYRAQFRSLVDEGQHPATLFIGCSDSRLVPYLLTGTGPGELFMVRNVGALVPPCCGTRDGGHHGTAAAIEFAVLQLKVQRIIVCGHTHCGAIRALYEDLSPEAVNLGAWLDLARDAVLPVRPGPEALRRTEQRAIALQLERLMDYPMVRRRVDAGELTLHGWHYVIEDGEVHVFDFKTGAFVPASRLADEEDLALPAAQRGALAASGVEEIALNRCADAAHDLRTLEADDRRQPEHVAAQGQAQDL